MCVTAVQWKLLAHADKPGSTPDNAVFCFLVPSLFFFVNTIFLLAFLSFILTAEPAGHALGSIHILSF